ncbi:MAG TPA: VOC family protein [Gaiellaceae bacterium]|jgi:catechol 2,3-dioxygenase-like lactoylglutathione lyase family enzyme|nr:VOC family protein [Gaiellaceae bacterium]
MNPTKLDHVAYWVADRDPVADFLTAHLGMHVIDRTDAFTLVGSDARRGKLTLFAADGPRERGALQHVALRVSRLGDALSALPESLEIERPRGGEAYFDVGEEGVRLGLVEAPTEIEYDLDHVALVSADPEAIAEAYGSLGFAPAAPGPSGAPRVEVGGAFVEFHRGEPGDPEKPLLNHLAVLVESADEHIAEANDLGVEIDNVVDAPNTYAVFLWGPERVRVEYVEHKPTFSLT